MKNNRKSDTEKINLIREGKKWALVRLLNSMKLSTKV